MTDPSRAMLSFVVSGTRFNYRVAGIALRDKHVLVCREEGDDYVMLPGGRVELNEASGVALAREMAEELQLDAPVLVGPLAFVAESFFRRDSQDFHEIGFYYRIEVPADVTFRSCQLWRQTVADGLALSFIWVPAREDMLRAIDLQPQFLCEELPKAAGPLRHLLVDERL